MSSVDESGANLLSNTEDVQHAISTLLRNAEQEAWLVSPYVTLDKLGWLNRAIRDALERKVAVSMIVRDEGYKTREVERAAKELVELGLDLRCVPNLHAKVYWTEKSAILTSLNLLASSMNNSIEVGVVVGTGPLHDQVRRFIDTQVIRYSGETPTQRKERERTEAAARRAEEKEERQRAKDEKRIKELTAQRGHCIRCATPVLYDLNKPYCQKDYTSWSRFANRDYVDKVCHGCGVEHAATHRQPLCGTCVTQLAAAG